MGGLDRRLRALEKAAGQGPEAELHSWGTATRAAALADTRQADALLAGFQALCARPDDWQQRTRALAAYRVLRPHLDDDALARHDAWFSAHCGPSTPVDDEVEDLAVELLVGDRLFDCDVTRIRCCTTEEWAQRIAVSHGEWRVLDTWQPPVRPRDAGVADRRGYDEPVVLVARVPAGTTHGGHAPATPWPRTGGDWSVGRGRRGQR